MFKKIQILILAAGKGKRMGGGEIPKVLQPVLGRPMMRWLLDSVEKSDIDPRPALVVGFGAEQVKAVFGSKFLYVEQKELLGTGHAVRQAETALKNRAENILVLYGDDPLISAETIKNLADMHTAGNSVITMATTRVSDFKDWRASFYDFGRIVRDRNGRFIGIREIRDATEEEKIIKEVNPGIYCFRASWLWNHLNKLQNNNAQKEYYLTDLVALAINGKEDVATIQVDPKECLGINSKEQLELVEKLLE